MKKLQFQKFANITNFIMACVEALKNVTTEAGLLSYYSTQDFINVISLQIANNADFYKYDMGNYDACRHLDG